MGQNLTGVFGEMLQTSHTCIFCSRLSFADHFGARLFIFFARSQFLEGYKSL